MESKMLEIKNIGVIILGLVGLVIVSCDNGNNPSDGQQNITLVGCWELVKVDSLKAGGHQIDLMSSDSAYFTALTFPFNESNTGEVNRSETEIKFEKWVSSNDSIKFINGNGENKISYPDSSVKKDPIKNINTSFGWRFKNDTLNLSGTWLEKTYRNYGYRRCTN
jgi:hypothetical protein